MDLGRTRRRHFSPMSLRDYPGSCGWTEILTGKISTGCIEFVIRSNHSETALNEALSLDLLSKAGLASQAAAYIRFTANDSEPRLRIAIENPDDIWLDAHFSEDGTLFKSEAEGNWSYRDENWESYVESFDLEAGGGDDDAENYAPLIAFSISSTTVTMPPSYPISPLGSLPTSSRSIWP